MASTNGQRTPATAGATPGTSTCLPTSRSHSPGYWAHNSKLDVTSCTILTAAAVEPVSQIHDRMPVILDPDAYDAWLDPTTPLEQARDQLGRNLNGKLRFYRVGRQVNSSKYEGGPDCLEPVNPL